MIRLLRLLPLLIPVVVRLLRVPAVRARLGLKPLDGNGRKAR